MYHYLFSSKNKNNPYAILTLAILCAPFTIATDPIKNSPKILHISFHKGCIKDFEDVAHEFSLDLTSWFILAHDCPPYYFDGKTNGNALYNIGHERAEWIWNKHKDYFNQFDLIITSDTAPLSRIFLQNGFTKPLIIWVCNRFDYCDGASLDCDFPDQEYYELIAKALHQENVKIISYTPYEYFYAQSKRVDIGTFTIKPIGTIAPCNAEDTLSAIPASIIKEETIFIPPYLAAHQKEYLLNTCAQLGITAYCGRYNGPCDIKDFKAVLHFPYQWSNVALFENIQNGLIYFIPSIKFVDELIKSAAPVAYFTTKHIEWAEWYREENKDLFVYFDSWQDLKQKIESVDYQTKREQIKLFAQKHRKIMLNRWRMALQDLTH